MPQGEVKAYEGCDILDGGPCLPCQQSIKLEAQIIVAKGPALNNLLILKRNLRTEINDHHDLITRRLPPELTSRVFEIYSEETNVRDWEISQYQVFKPLVLGAVCQTWRHIAWSSPSLWTRICISLKVRMKRAHVDEVEGWLLRSGQLPLSMLIEFSLSITPTNARLCCLILIINQHSNHWQNLYIECYHNQLGLICGDSRGAPILRNLSISGLGSDPHWGNYIFSPPMDGMKPRPSRVQLRFISLKSVNIYWSDITDIELIGGEFIHLDECIELLRQAPQLMNCRIAGISTSTSADWKAFLLPYQLAVPHGLQSLFLEDAQGKDIGMFFQSFTFPNLTHLYLTDIDDCITSLWSSVISLSNRSSMCLTSLKIYGTICDSEMLIQILQNLPCLVDVAVTPYHINLQVHQLLSALANDLFLDTLGHYQTSFLPKLQSIHCGHCDSDPWDLLFWKSVSQLFGPWKDGKPTTCIRPLQTVSIQGSVALGLNVASKICTDRNILLHLVELSRSGVHFALKSNDVDLLHGSMEHHGIT